MIANDAGAAGPEGRDAVRPFAFLVSTTGCARAIRSNLGSAAYSYYFVLEALAPVLEPLGPWRLIDRPESSLAFAAARARAEGYRPVHLVLNPPQDGYFTPEVPTVLFPFWEFPNVPDRDFGFDTRQNWVRMCRPADLIVTACQFTASAFRRAGVRGPVAVVPVPLDPTFFDLPDWDPSHCWTIDCRHLILGSEEKDNASVATDEGDARAVPAPSERQPRRGRRALRLARAAFRRVYPYLRPETVDRITWLKQWMIARAGPSALDCEGRLSARRAAYAAVRAAYRRYVRRWLSDEAIEQIDRVKHALLGRSRDEPAVVVAGPRLPSSPLTLGGLVYTTILNLSDRRKNYIDLLTAFLIAFADRPDVTLVIKMATSAWREPLELKELREVYQALGLRHQCRVVVITDFLSEEQLGELMRVTTYYVNTSHAEGSCLPLQRALAGGRPALAPRHTALADYMDDRVGFVVASHPEPTFWPHDPGQTLETFWHRLVWSDLRDRLLESAEVVARDPQRFAAMARAGRERMADYAARPVSAQALREALALLPEEVWSRRFAWAS